MVALNYEKIKNLERASNIIPFIITYILNGINYPSKIDDWENFEKNNSTIPLNVPYIKEKEIYPVYISKIDLNCKKKTIFLMIPNKEE